MKTAKYAFACSLPVMAGYLVLGLGFGVLLESKGYGVGWAFAMSTLIYAGSMQYVAVDLLAGGASLIAAALMTVTVNARHLFYGISMVERYRHVGPAKPYMIFALTDETYSLVCSGTVPDGVDQKRYFFLVSLFDHLYWIAGSVAGALVGGVLPFDSTGIDFSMTALSGGNDRTMAHHQRPSPCAGGVGGLAGLSGGVWCRGFPHPRHDRHYAGADFAAQNLAAPRKGGVHRCSGLICMPPLWWRLSRG